MVTGQQHIAVGFDERTRGNPWTIQNDIPPIVTRSPHARNVEKGILCIAANRVFVNTKAGIVRVELALLDQKDDQPVCRHVLC